MVAKDFVSIAIVSLLWGCTNPLLRSGATEAENNDRVEKDTTTQTKISLLESILNSLSKFKKPSVLVPYLLNQSGSIVYYKLLATSDLSNTIPMCNALAMVFSFIAGHFLGERLDKPFQAFIGCLLVTCGVIVCMFASEDSVGTIGNSSSDEL